ncbi:MAG: class I SAM-dependent methyltransferase [Candidatus Cloacimonetes bacterium]|nr:class I SAM-dependent methyltransferase [Candidatus Cloacimonadota bacterium]
MLEKMDEFFENRIDSYEEHMLSLSHIKNGYIKFAELLPENSKYYLNLGCGTGLELVEIFKRFPDIYVTGIDMSQKMLDILHNKFPDKNIYLIKANYLEYDFGNDIYDTVISYQTLHHLEHKTKTNLYKKIFNALVPNGQYIECDYMVFTQEEEDFHFSESEKLRLKQGINNDEIYHFDTPCTVKNQIMMLQKAGFINVKEEWRDKNAVKIRAIKYQFNN